MRSIALVVAPHAGAWIETTSTGVALPCRPVAPHAGAWIETRLIRAMLEPIVASPPTRGRGLKPHVGDVNGAELPRRPPRGGVD